MTGFHIPSRQNDRSTQPLDAVCVPLKTYMTAGTSSSSPLTELCNDCSTLRLFNAFSNLHGEINKLVAISMGLGTRAVKAEKDELVRDLLAWVLPRIISAIGRVGIPMPRVEYKRGKISGALDALKMGPGQTGGVVLDVVPDQVVVRTSNEEIVDMREPNDESTGDGASTSSSSRVQVHIDGVRVAVKKLGYFASYGGRALGYSDQGLLDLEIGSPEAVHLGARAQGLSLDIHISFDISPQTVNSGNSPGPPTSFFEVIDVRATFHGVRFKLNKSKHWILNKMLMQPLAGPVVSWVATAILEAKIRAGLERLSSGLAIIMDAARQSRKHGTAEEAEVGIVDYWEALLEKGPEAFGITSSAEEREQEENTPSVETHSRTTATLTGVVHTTTEALPGLSSQEAVETETSLAIGGRSMIVSDKAGAYGVEDDAGVLERAALELDSVVGQAKAAVENAVEDTIELRGEMERAEERREERKKLESSRADGEVGCLIFSEAYDHHKCNLHFRPS